MSASATGSWWHGATAESARQLQVELELHCKFKLNHEYASRGRVRVSLSVHCQWHSLAQTQAGMQACTVTAGGGGPA